MLLEQFDYFLDVRAPTNVHELMFGDLFISVLYRRRESERQMLCSRL